MGSAAPMRAVGRRCARQPEIDQQVGRARLKQPQGAGPPASTDRRQGCGSHPAEHRQEHHAADQLDDRERTGWHVGAQHHGRGDGAGAPQHGGGRGGGHASRDWRPHPPDRACLIAISSVVATAVSRSRMASWFTKTYMWGRSCPCSSTIPKPDARKLSVKVGEHQQPGIALIGAGPHLARHRAEVPPTGSLASTVMAWRFTVSQPRAGRPASPQLHYSPGSRVTCTAGRPSGFVLGHTSVPSIGNTHSVPGPRGCSSIGKPMSPISVGMSLPTHTHRPSGRSMR